jgi:hypothetical protein
MAGLTARLLRVAVALDASGLDALAVHRLANQVGAALSALYPDGTREHGIITDALGAMADRQNAGGQGWLGYADWLARGLPPLPPDVVRLMDQLERAGQR